MYVTQSNNNRNQSFTSYLNREAILNTLRELQIEREAKKHTAQIAESLKYPELEDVACKKTANFMLNFAAETIENSTHKLQEFFSSDNIASKVRGDLTPKCQQDSLEMRNAIKESEILQDPVLGLISANNMKKFIPDEAVLSNKQYKNIVDSTKNAYIDAIEDADMKKFDEEDKGIIKNLVGIIKNTDGLNFGEEFDKQLKLLIDKKNLVKTQQTIERSKQKVFVPPVQVKYNGKS